MSECGPGCPCPEQQVLEDAAHKCPPGGDAAEKTAALDAEFEAWAQMMSITMGGKRRRKIARRGEGLAAMMARLGENTA